jgi:hypothetical protein
MESFEVADSSPVGCGTISSGKRYFPQGVLLHLQNATSEE